MAVDGTGGEFPAKRLRIIRWQAMRLNGARIGTPKITIAIALITIRTDRRRETRRPRVAVRGIITCLECIRCVAPSASMPDRRPKICSSASDALQTPFPLNDFDKLNPADFQASHQTQIPLQNLLAKSGSNVLSFNY